jgi:hypothetical protein
MLSLENAFCFLTDPILAAQRAGRAGIPLASKGGWIAIDLTAPFHLIWRRTIGQ